MQLVKNGTGEQRCPSRVSRCKSSETLGEFCSFEEVKVAKCCYWFMACAEASLAGRWDQGLFVCLVLIHLFVFACAGSSLLCGLLIAVASHCRAWPLGCANFSSCDAQA